LKSDNNFRIWMAGYDEHGIWSVDRALLAVNSERASRRRRRRTINQPSRQVRQRSEAIVGTLPLVTAEIELPILPASIPHEPLLRQRTEANVDTLPVVTAENSLPILPASIPHEPFLLRDTASSTFVPFLCAVAGNPHSRINDVENLVNASHAGLWNTMILRTQYVLQYVFQFGNEQDRERVNRDNWPWIHNRGQDTYMHAADQEWILQLESSYPEIVYPPGLEHVDLTVTCGELLQAHAHEWELARHDGSNSNN
jgi:hypothetical protein